MKTYLKCTAAALAATLALAGCSSPETPTQQSTASKSLSFEEIHEGHYGTLTGVWASADSKLLIDNDSIIWTLNAKRYGTIYGRHFAPADESTTSSYAKATGSTQDGAYVLTWSPADSGSTPGGSASAQASGAASEASTSASASSAPSNSTEGSAGSSETVSTSTAPSASTSANPQATTGEQSSAPSGARLIIYPVGVAIKNPTGSIVDSDTSTVRIVAIPDTTTTDYTKYVMKQVSTALPSTATASASTSASASAVPSSSMSFSPSPSAPASEPAKEEKKPLSLGMNLDQIAKGDFSSIQGAWQSGGRSLYVVGNKAEWSVGSRVYAELDGTKIYGVQERDLRGTATARTEGGVLRLTWPSGQVLSFYPAGVPLPMENGYVPASDLSKDRIVSGKVAQGEQGSVMTRVTDMPEYSRVAKNAGRLVDAAEYADDRGYYFRSETANGPGSYCRISSTGVKCQTTGAVNYEKHAVTVYMGDIMPNRPNAGGGPVQAYMTGAQSLLVMPPSSGQGKVLEPGQKISVHGFTCSVLDASVIQCFEENGGGFIVSPNGAVRLPVQDKLYYFNSEFVTD